MRSVNVDANVPRQSHRKGVAMASAITRLRGFFFCNSVSTRTPDSKTVPRSVVGTFVPLWNSRTARWLRTSTQKVSCVSPNVSQRASRLQVAALNGAHVERNMLTPQT